MTERHSGPRGAGDRDDRRRGFWGVLQTGSTRDPSRFSPSFGTRFPISRRPVAELERLLLSRRVVQAQLARVRQNPDVYAPGTAASLEDQLDRLTTRLAGFVPLPKETPIEHVLKMAGEPT